MACVVIGAFAACSQAGLDGPGMAAGTTGDLGFDPGDNAADICGNGLDDNGNGEADESCVCTPGEKQDCYAGPPPAAGVGNCSKGSQTCIETETNEVSTVGVWGACKGWVPPLTEVCADGEDSDCDGNEDCPECESIGECPPPLIGTGSGGPGSGSGDFNNGGAGPGSGSGDFNNGGGPSSGSGDNNNGGAGPSSGSGDNNTSSASGLFSSSATGLSSGSGDNNSSAASSGSGGGDECICKPGTTRWCDTPIGCLWGKQVCAPDMTWGNCEETAARPPGCENEDFYDTGCCLAAPNACCQNPFTDASLGDCTLQLDCSAY